METTQTSTIASIDSRSGWRKTDTMWMLGLYGTAIGAGVLFLPINAGVGGMIPLIIMAIIAFPMTFFAHRGLTRFVLSGKNPGEDITEVVEEHFPYGRRRLDIGLPVLRFPGKAGVILTVRSFCRSVWRITSRTVQTSMHR